MVNHDTPKGVNKGRALSVVLKPIGQMKNMNGAFYLDKDTIPVSGKKVEPKRRHTVFEFYEIGQGLGREQQKTGDEYEDALYEIHTKKEKSFNETDLKKIQKIQSIVKGQNARKSMTESKRPEDLVNKGWDAKAASGAPDKDTELRVYIKNAVIPEAGRAFVRVQLRRYVCTTDWSAKTTEPRWDEELRKFVVKSLNDEVEIKILCSSRNGAPKLIDQLRVPLRKVDRAGGELRRKFYMDSRTPVNLILTLITDESDFEEQNDSDESDYGPVEI